MTLNPEEQIYALRRLRAKNKFGVSEDVLEISEKESRANQDSEPETYTKPLNPEEVLGHILDMPDFDLRDEYDPGSSSQEEMDARIKDLKYRKSWLDALLSITEEELKVFEGALKVAQAASAESEKDKLKEAQS